MGSCTLFVTFYGGEPTLYTPFHFVRVAAELVRSLRLVCRPMIYLELEDSLIISEAWGDTQKRKEGEPYLTITRVDLLVRKVCMFINVEMGMMKNKKVICKSVSISSTACVHFRLGLSFFSFDSFVLFCFWLEKCNGEHPCFFRSSLFLWGGCFLVRLCPT